MSSATSTERAARSQDGNLRPWHFFMLLAMLGATVAVIKAQDTHPASLLLLSAAVLGAGAVGAATHTALQGFFGAGSRKAAPLGQSTRAGLEAEKALVLRSIKELEFDRAMRKVSDADFAEIGARLRKRALDLMEQLERTPAEAPAPVKTPAKASRCPSCQTSNDPDAAFCKRCGTRLG